MSQELNLYLLYLLVNSLNRKAKKLPCEWLLLLSLNKREELPLRRVVVRKMLNLVFTLLFVWGRNLCLYVTVVKTLPYLFTF